MGIVQNVPEGTVATFSRLSDEVETLSLSEQELVGCTVSVKHIGRRETEFENVRGETVMWHAEFVGKHESIMVNDERIPAEIFTRSGVDVSRVTVSVPAGTRVCAKV
jgi:hypothetical protein